MYLEIIIVICSCFTFSEFEPALDVFHGHKEITTFEQCNDFYNTFIELHPVLMATLFGGITFFTIFEILFSIIILRMFLSKVLLLTLQCNRTNIELSASKSRSKSKVKN